MPGGGATCGTPSPLRIACSHVALHRSGPETHRRRGEISLPAPNLGQLPQRIGIVGIGRELPSQNRLDLILETARAQERRDHIE